MRILECLSRGKLDELWQMKEKMSLTMTLMLNLIRNRNLQKLNQRSKNLTNPS
jgi:hypothetical protein